MGMEPEKQNGLHCLTIIFWNVKNCAYVLTTVDLTPQQNETQVQYLDCINTLNLSTK